MAAMNKEAIQEKFTNHSTEIGRLKGRVDELNLFTVAMVVVLLIGFAQALIATGAIFYDHFNSREASYQDLIKEIRANSDNYQTETTNFKLEIGNLSNQVENLKIRNPYLK